MKDTYLIPANAKRSMLILSVFYPIDLVIFLVGLLVSVVLLLALPIESVVYAIVALVPGLVAAFLVLPIPNYHNVRTILRSAFIFYTTRQKFIWKGWCFNYEDEEIEKQIYK